MSQSFSVLLRTVCVLGSLVTSSAVFACDLAAHADGASSDRAPCHQAQNASGAKDVSMSKLRSPQWNNSLHGDGALNLSSAQAQQEPRTQGQDPQVGPLRLSHVGLVPPPSFTGSLSRIVSNPSF